MEIFLDGKWFKECDAKTLVYEPGVLYAQGLFETMRADDKKIFRLDAHLRRLIQAAPRIKIILDYTQEQLKDIIAKAVSLVDYGFVYVRLTVWQGKIKAHISVIAKEYKPYTKEKYSSGAKAILSSLTQNETSILTNIKSSSRLHLLLAEKQARKQNADEAILLNSKGKLAEGSRSNIFLIKNNIVFTPNKESGCLLGITRAVLIDIARANKIKIYEKEIEPDELFLSDEAFLTNSLIGVMPLAFLDDKRIGEGRIGKLTAVFLKDYQELAQRG